MLTAFKEIGTLDATLGWLSMREIFRSAVVLQRGARNRGNGLKCLTSDGYFPNLRIRQRRLMVKALFKTLLRT
jgi:hypothetical protein